MGKPKGTIGETKLKILAILSHNDTFGYPSYGYQIWKILNERYYCCLSEGGLRNVYHHLRDLHRQQLITSYSRQPVEGTPERRLYRLTEKGGTLKKHFERYRKALKPATELPS